MKQKTVWKYISFQRSQTFERVLLSLKPSRLRPLVLMTRIFLRRSLGAPSPLCYKQLVRGWGTSKHNCLVHYFIMLTTTCFGHCGPSSGNKNSYTLLRRGTLSSVCVIQPTTRSRRKFRICTYTITILCIVFLYIHFCDQKMAHSGRNMSSSA